jgi:hypothetical protein
MALVLELEIILNAEAVFRCLRPLALNTEP